MYSTLIYHFSGPYRNPRGERAFLTSSGSIIKPSVPKCSSCSPRFPPSVSLPLYTKREMSTANLQGDPRRPGALHPFVRATVSEDDRPADYYALLALVFGLIAFSSRVRGRLGRLQHVHV